MYTKGENIYRAGEFSQTTGYHKFGIPGNWSVEVSNDVWGDGGDRFRTSYQRINLFGGLVRIGNPMFTGDPGLHPDDRKTDVINGRETYIPAGPWSNPDKYRHGILYIGLGPINIGLDSEGIRHLFQNRLAHDRIKVSPYFRDLRGTPEYREMGGHRFFFQLGWGGIW